MAHGLTSAVSGRHSVPHLETSLLLFISYCTNLYCLLVGQGRVWGGYCNTLPQPWRFKVKEVISSQFCGLTPKVSVPVGLWAFLRLWGWADPCLFLASWALEKPWCPLACACTAQVSAPWISLTDSPLSLSTPSLTVHVSLCLCLFPSISLCVCLSTCLSLWVSCIPGCPWTQQWWLWIFTAGFLIFTASTSKGWDSRPAPLRLVSAVLGIESRISCMPASIAAHSAISPDPGFSFSILATGFSNLRNNLWLFFSS